MSRIDTFPDPLLNNWPTTGSVIILDLEYTSWSGSMRRNWAGDWEFREIVQFGAVRLNVKPHEFITEETFERIVKPVKNPQLSDHFSNLTGITNSLVQKKGCGFEKAFAEFFDFVSDSNKIWCIGYDGEVLRENAFLNQIPYPFSKDQVVNIRPALSKIIGIPENQIISCKLPEILDIVPPKKNHSAIDDAICTYRALNHLRKKGLL